MKMRNLWRAVSLLFAWVAISTSMLGCSALGSKGPDANANTISFWVRAADENFVRPLVSTYNTSHKTQVKLTTVPDAQFVTKFGTAVAGGDAPDVVAIDLVYMPSFAAANEMADITDMAHSLSFYNQLSPSHIRLSTYNNKLYALPFSAEGSVLLYNKKLFQQAGLDPNKPPTNWSELEAYSKKITALGNGVKGYYFSGRCAGCNAFTFLPYIWASGGDVLSDDGKTATLTSSPAVKDALNFYKRLWDEGQMPAGARVDDGSNGLNAFATGNVGMAASGAFSIGTIKQQHPNIDFGITYLPGENGNFSSFAGGDTIGIPRGSKHVNEASDFIKWALSEDVQVNQFAKNGSIPVRTDLAENKYSQLDPRYVTTSQAMAKGRTPYSVHYNQLFNDANGPWLAMLQKAIFDGQVDNAMKTAQDQFTTILNS